MSSQARSFATGWWCRRLEDPALDLLGHSRPGVGELTHTWSGPAPSYGQRSVSFMADTALSIRFVHTWFSSPA